MNLTLNQGQQEAAEGLFSFLLGPDKEAAIIGPGGTGKTRLMAYFINTIMPRYFEACELLGMKPEYESVHMTATTNQAAEVLSQQCGQATSTIHSFLGLKVSDDYTSGKSNITKTQGWRVHERIILFVDEAGMIDSKLHNFINEGTHKCKVIYVGDDCQLRAVMEPDYSVFDRVNETFELTESMRTTVPALMSLNNQLRTTVRTGEFQPIRLVPGVIDLCDEQDMLEGIQHMFVKQQADCRIIAYSNGRVVEYNDHIRAEKGYGLDYVVDEVLINNNGMRHKDYQMSVSEQFTVVELETPKQQKVEEDVYLDYREVTLMSKFGQLLEGVKIPCDRVHYDKLMKYYAKEKNFERYFFLKNNFADLRPRDGSTVHKIQGSTHDTAFIDLSNIGSCRNPDQTARLLYVAFTRVRRRVYVYGDLPRKYGGIIR